MKLQEDYSIFRKALEETHPGLYWFTPKDSMDLFFEDGFRHITDSMTESAFRTLLTGVVAKIRCGHTGVGYSREYTRYLDTARLKIFPLSFKVLGDTLAVTANLNREDSILTRGTVVTAVNGHSSRQLIDTFLQYVTSDGYAATGRYQTISSFGRFGVLYKNLFGLTDSFRIRYIASTGLEQETIVPTFIPPAEEEKADSLKSEKNTSKERRSMRAFSTRSLQVDTLLESGYMMLNTFAPGNGLRGYINRSFRNIRRLKLKHLVIDVRSNGGGDAANAILLTQYLSDHPFIVADSLYAIKRSSRYRDYIRFQPLYWLVTTIITSKKQDGNFHFGYFEKHRFKPFVKNHFNGQIYILTGGNSFSATTLFLEELKGQSNVTIIGEETGGGAYGNSAWIIPTLTLPNTKLKVAIPRFRFVMRKELAKDGRGVMPDIYVTPTTEDIRRGIDVKLETVRKLIFRANGL